jgi:glycosyltransferase involved in cell wall biosynthesis
MKQYSPDAWLVYDPSRTYPDLFGWWQRPKRYVLFGAHSWQSADLPRIWRWLFGLAHRRSLARADQVVAVRPSSAANLIRLRHVPAKRLCVLPHAVRIWDCIPSREDARRRFGIPLESPVILSASRFTEETEGSERKTEMILNLLAAFALIDPSVLLVVAGDGPGRWRAELRVAQLKLEGRVRLMGAIPNDEMKWFYAACDLYAYPLTLDRPWVSILEAQACGRPVITMHTKSAEITVEAGRTGLLARDLDEFQAHLAALASDRARCEAMGQAAREYIERCHSMEVRARQIEVLLTGQEENAHAHCFQRPTGLSVQSP